MWSEENYEWGMAGSCNSFTNLDPIKDGYDSVQCKLSNSICSQMAGGRGQRWSFIMNWNCRNWLCQGGCRGACFIVCSPELDRADFRLCVCVFKLAQFLIRLPRRMDFVLTAPKKWRKGEAWVEFCSFHNVETFPVLVTVLITSGYLFSSICIFFFLFM